MIGTALLIVLGLVIVGLCILGVNAGLERGLNRSSASHDEADLARDEALRHISRDISKGDGAGFF